MKRSSERPRIKIMRARRLLCALLAAGMLAGCGSSLAEYAESAGAQDSAEAETEQVTITNPISDLVILNSHRDMSDYRWNEVKDPDVVEISLQESIRFFSEGGSGILYYGRENCPWCQRAFPVLAEAAEEMGVTIYYIDVDRGDTDESGNLIRYVDNDDQISLESAEGTAVYNNLVSYISSTFNRDEDGNPMFQVPLVIGVKHGAITGSHVGVTDGFVLTDENAQMSDSQRIELKVLYETIISDTAD